jgi:hypothetical protein
MLRSAAKLSVQVRIAGGENELHACHAGRFRCVLYLTEWEIMRPFCGNGNALNVAIKKYFVSTAPVRAWLALLHRRKSERRRADGIDLGVAQVRRHLVLDRQVPAGTILSSYQP